MMGARRGRVAFRPVPRHERKVLAGFSRQLLDDAGRTLVGRPCTQIEGDRALGRRLRISPATLRSWRHRGSIPERYRNTVRNIVIHRMQGVWLLQRAVERHWRQTGGKGARWRRLERAVARVVGENALMPLVPPESDGH
jgi:hypothetical protein